MLTDDNLLTVVLTLKGRPEFTFRWMCYAEHAQLPFKVLIADGGDDPAVEKALSEGGRFGRLDYEYLRYPYDRTGSEYYEKLADVVTRVDTPFVAMADNDDFPVVNGLQAAVQQLHSNPDFACARGRVVAIQVGEEEAEEFPRASLYNAEVAFVSGAYDVPTIDAKRARTRVRRHFGDYRPTWYDVHRTDQLRRTFAVQRDLDLGDFRLAELLTSVLDAVSGKLYRDDKLFLVRQMNPPTRESRSEAISLGNSFTRMLQPNWSGDFDRMAEALAVALSSSDGMPVEEAGRQIRKDYVTYIAPYIVKTLAKRVRSDSDISSRSRTIRPGAQEAEFVAANPELNVIREFLAGCAGVSA